MAVIGDLGIRDCFLLCFSEKREQNKWRIVSLGFGHCFVGTGSSKFEASNWNLEVRNSSRKSPLLLKLPLPLPLLLKLPLSLLLKLPRPPKLQVLEATTTAATEAATTTEAPGTRGCRCRCLCRCRCRRSCRFQEALFLSILLWSLTVSLPILLRS